MRGLGSGNVDFRLRQTDFSPTASCAGGFWLGMPLTDIRASTACWWSVRPCARITR